MTNAVIILSTCANRDEAERIARALVQESLAACVQLLPPMQSIYRWQGAVETSEEILMLSKTTEERFSAVAARINELHSYDTPEIVAMPISAGAEKYLEWLNKSINAG